jgi:dipeptidyl aminopeptidase/acylaminoacyl peptidase
MFAYPTPARKIPVLRSALSAALCGLACLAQPAAAQPAATGYQLPPKEILAIADAPPTPWVVPTPDRRSLLVFGWDSLTPIGELAEPELRLAGQRIQPRFFGLSRTRPFTGMAIQSLADRSLRPVTGLPPAPWLINVKFSPSGKKVALTHRAEKGWELWVVDLESAAARRITQPVLSLTLRVAPAWVDESRLVAVLQPEGRGLPPEAPAVPSGPVVQETLGQQAQVRTFQDLLRNEHDQNLFRYYMSSQLVRIDLDGKLEKLGGPALYSRVEPSPDGKYLLVETLQEPFSYVVRWENFPTRIEIWDAAGKSVRQLADRPLQEAIPIAFGSVPPGPRQAEWRGDQPATLAWAEAQDGGDSGKEAPLRDKLFSLAAPFRGEPALLATLKLRYAGVRWGTDELAMVSEFQWKDRKVRMWRIEPGQAGAPAKLLVERSMEDSYNDPGAPAMWRNERGREVIITDAGSSILYWIGEGASPEGNRPFLDRHHLADDRRERLFRSEAPFYENPESVLDAEAHYVLVRRESVDDPPNYFVRDLKENKLAQVTAFPHPAPQLRGLKKELIKYQRKDGVALSGTLYLPPGYDPAKGPVPTVMWAYPREFKSADNAGQVNMSPYRFDRILGTSPLLYLAMGYAVLDDPQMPIVGEKDEEPNDHFVEQLSMSAQAAVDEVVRRGIAAPGHIAVGGHSYGAFMTANLLAHTDLFGAGLAYSGAYNRTLTPFGFQSEERTLWQAPEVYAAMSPFMYADKIKEPILLVHGEADSNAGTFPLQTERFYSALKGHGATVRYVTLPYESHGYQARESTLHVLFESWRWLDTYIGFKDEKKPQVEVATEAPN